MGIVRLVAMDEDGDIQLSLARVDRDREEVQIHVARSPTQPSLGGEATADAEEERPTFDREQVTVPSRPTVDLSSDTSLGHRPSHHPSTTYICSIELP